MTPPGAITSLSWLSPVDLVATGFFARGRVAVLDSTGKPRRFLGELPPGDLAVPIRVRQHAFQSALALNRTVQRVALATRHADRLDIYSMDGRSHWENKRLFMFDPIYEVGQGADGPIMASGENLRFGYIAIAAASDRIYALYSGRTRGGFPGRATFGQYVHVYDWNAKLVGVLKLNDDVIDVAVDVSGKVLYGLRHDPDPAVVRYSVDRAAINKKPE